MIRTILASASPRRQELLTQIGINFDVCPSNCEEIITCEEPEDIVKELALQKAADVADRTIGEDVLVIGADTIVVCEGEILGKPKNEADAMRMLHKLMGKTHEVYTGVALISRRGGSEQLIVFAEKTEVDVCTLKTDELKYYVESGEPMDKAGAYGIQGKFAKFITGIRGDYYNVVGLPVCRLYHEMKLLLYPKDHLQEKI